ncbi:MAG: cell division protein ZapA [Deltaproteobacteria bacterium]|nr:MAG: cell division protein ZapA [Deltaproteobacteria bacterium]
MQKRAVEVEIFGQQYVIRSDLSEEQIKEVANYVNEKMREVAEGTKSVNTLHIAILAALNIANEYLQEKGKKEELLQRIKEKTERLEEFIAFKMG